MPVEVIPALAPGESARAVVAALQIVAADSSVMLVGHEPGISGIGALLLGLADLAPLGKAEALRITDGQLRWRFAWDAEAPTTAR